MLPPLLLGLDGTLVDSLHDIESGCAAGVSTVGVTWGAATRDEMARAGADEVIHEVRELAPLVARFAAAAAAAGSARG